MWMWKKKIKLNFMRTAKHDQPLSNSKTKLLYFMKNNAPAQQLLKKYKLKTEAVNHRDV